ncbi:transcriptional protein SWT1 isoform X2 [Harpegnathos saltator]|uniref:transcriptional protein SWT1 isoform X2 n=1 Tax=Harpegnathos saltator TaxID=610380 RepID=UPI00058F491B|nr:transcriptional protein SWT1 isoform X2 [Harpegnathos saltator]
MKKSKLPKNWIIVSSKSHPDRIYYFNVKTNKSTWKEPVLEQANNKPSEHIKKRRKNYHEEEERSRARTPEYDFVENKTSQQQSLNNRKISQVKRKSSQKTKRTVEEKQNNQTNTNLAHAELPMQNLRKNLHYGIQKYERDNCSIIDKKSLKRVGKTLPVSCLEEDETPQMKALREKILQKKLAKSAIKNNLLDKILKKDLKGEQELKITKQTLVKTSRKQEKNIPNKRSADWSKYDAKPKRSYQTKKNLAQDRMQKLRESLHHEMQKHEDCSIITEIPSEGLNKILPVSCYSKNFESTSIHKNTEVRLKRLHNRVLKETIYKRNAKLKNDLHVQQKRELCVSNMTKDKLIERTNREVLYEEMDWEPMKDEEITLEVEVVRAQLNSKNCTNVSNCPSENTTVLTQPIESQEKGPLYIVIDTNVFLTNLEIIEQARDVTFKNYPRPFIVIPWTVIRELDYLKSDKSRSETLRTKARTAISFINEHFASKHPRIVGQTREQASTNKEVFFLDCPDDEVLQCCLQIKNLKKDVVLLSYDKNLCTKAMIHCITAVGRHDSLETLDNLNTSDETVNPLSNKVTQCSLLSEELRFSDEFFEDAKLIMKDLFSTIIVKQMTECFGEEWETYVIIKPPWTVVTALKCIVKHWIAAINGSFQTYAESITRELLEIFEHLPVGGRKLQDVEYVLEKCSDLIQAINTDKHYELMVQSFNAIMELKKKCLKCIVDTDRKKLHDKIGIVEDAQIQEQRAEKVLQCFKQIYSYARDLCGLAAHITGKVYPLGYNPINPPLPDVTVRRLHPDITKKVTDLSCNLNKLLEQAENDSIKYQTLIVLQQDLNSFLAYKEIVTLELEPLDIFCCVTLKEEVLKFGLRQLQELSTHSRALYLTTCT